MAMRQLAKIVAGKVVDVILADDANDDIRAGQSLADWLAALGGNWMDVTGREVSSNDEYDDQGDTFSQPADSPMQPSEVITLEEFREIAGMDAVKAVRARAQTNDDAAAFWEFASATGVMYRTDTDYGQLVTWLYNQSHITQDQATQLWPAEFRP